MRRALLSTVNARATSRAAALSLSAPASGAEAPSLALISVQSVDAPFSTQAGAGSGSIRTFATDAHHFTPTTGNYLDPEGVRERLMEVVKSFKNVNAEKLTPSAHFINDLGLDSLDTVEIVMAFEEEFKIEIPDAEAEKLQTINDAIKYITAHPHAK